MRGITLAMLSASLHALELYDLSVLPCVGPLSHRVRDDISALTFNLLRIDLQAAIAIRQQPRIELPFSREAHHQCRYTQRQVFIPIGMPGVPGLAVGVHYFFH